LNEKYNGKEHNNIESLTPPPKVKAAAYPN
jgi:hypothetical protein